MNERLDPDRNDEMPSAKPTIVPPKDKITGGFSEGADFISSIVAGLLIGFVLDGLFGTRPVMTLLWAIAGIGVGFWRMWRQSEDLEEQARQRPRYDA